MTPKAQAVQKALGGGVTFLGQWEPLGVFLVAKRDDAGPGPRRPVAIYDGRGQLCTCAQRRRCVGQIAFRGADAIEEPKR